MPDDAPGAYVKGQPIEQLAASQAVNPQVSPDSPGSPSAQSVTDEGVERAIQAVEDRVKRAEWWMIGLTAAIAMFALGTVVVGIYQWREMRGTLDLTREQVHIGQRAYLIEYHTAFTHKPSIGEPIELQFDVKNTGQTPAQQIQFSATAGVMIAPPDAVNYQLPPPGDSLGAGQERTFHGERLQPLTADEFADTNNPDEEMSITGNTLKITTHRHIVMYGLIVYRDVFGGTGQTEFCVVYLASKDKFAGCNSRNSVK